MRDKKLRKIEMEQTAQWQFKSQAGSLYLVASAKGLRGVYWNKQEIPMATSLGNQNSAIQILKQTVSELEEYFSGDRKTFNIPFDVVGTPFQNRVWNELSRINYGTTCSYRDIASRIKNEKAFRAVGSANGKNPLSIIVPCHRVIAADGSLGGYSGGLQLKKKLLNLEKGELLT